jgi:peptidyl-prolyl isomerase D
VQDAVIADCGELTGDAALAADVKAADAFGDAFEDFPEDLDGPVTAAKVLEVATACKDYGNAAFKAGDLTVALGKYQKGLRYLNEEPSLDDEPPETKEKLTAVRISLNTNSALMHNKLQDWEEGIRSATSAVDIAGIKDADKAKALFRRGVAHIGLRDEESALKDLEAAHKLVPADASIKAELTRVRKKVSERAAKEKAAYKKFFK